MGRTACTEPQCLYKGDLYHFLPILQQHVTVSKGKGKGKISPRTGHEGPEGE